MTQSKKPNPKAGLALIAVLGMLMLSMVLMIGMLSLSQKMNQTARQYTSKVQTEVQSDSLSDRVRLALLNIVQTKMALTASSSEPPINLDDESQIKTMIKNSIFLDEANEQITRVRCVGQGSKPAGECDSSEILPKIYDFSVQSIDSATGTLATRETEIQIQQAGLSSYAFFIKNETNSAVTLGPAVFSGIFGVNFAPSVDNPTISFRPGSDRIVFENVFMTNLANPQASFGIEDASRVNFQRGVVGSSQGVSFDNLNSLHSSLKNTAINVGDFQASATPGCSKITLTATSEIQYQEYETPDCSGEPSFGRSYIPATNQAIRARGEKVLLDSSDPSGKTGVGNIAILADADVELRSSIVRSTVVDDVARDPLDGFPTIMTSGNLVISGEMKSLLPNSQTLGEVTSTPEGDGPTIQVDLSYISVKNASTQQSGSLKFDPSLIGAANTSEAINLGRAVFNGLFISEVTPQSRRLFPGSNLVDGFSDVDWSYPPALSAIATDWFLTQLNGGALRATATRYEKRNVDISQALSTFPETPNGN